MHLTMLALPYTGSLFWIYNFIRSFTRDNRPLAKSMVGIIVTATYIACYGAWQLTGQGISKYAVEHVASIMIAYYLVDSYLLINGGYVPHRWMYVTHHCFAIKLIRAHTMGSLPIAIGVHYMSLFECSNLCMQLFLMCKEQGWQLAGNVLMLPFVATYVPLRMFGIPLYSMMYVECLRGMPMEVRWYNGAMLAFVNVFSVHFAGVVLGKFVKVISGLPKPSPRAAVLRLLRRDP